MRQNILFGLSLFITIAFASCEKGEFHTIAPPDPDTPDNPTGIPLIKEESGDDYTGTFKYNSKGQVVEELWTDEYKVVYSYFPNLIEIKEYDSTSTLKKVRTLKLNDKGLCVEQTESGNSRTYFFEYDDQNRIIRDYALNADGSKGNEFFFFYDEEGNMVKDSLARTDGNWNVYKNEFYTDLPNTAANKNYGKTYSGEQSKHCMKRRVMTSSVGEIHLYDYVRPLQDEEGRVIERRVITTNVNQNTSGSYYYQYKYY